MIYQGSERATGCQFSYACDGSMARLRSAAAMARATRIAAAALNGYVMGAVGLATHYHTYAVTPSWNRSLVMTDAIGAHFFHRWKGYWGTPAAFSNARYRGGEPVPGPHRKVDPPLAADTADRVSRPARRRRSRACAGRENRAGGDPAQISGRQRGEGADASADNLPGDSQILDRWKDSGKPLQ